MKMLFLKLKCSISPIFPNLLAIFLASSLSASNGSTKPKRTKSAILTSTGMVQQLAAQVSHKPAL
jgi:hypothetical protein